MSCHGQSHGSETDKTYSESHELSLIRSLYVVKKYAFHLAMIGAQSATIYASDRPWWEADVAAEMARIEAQNLYILSEIEAELRYHNAAMFEELERPLSIIFNKQSDGGPSMMRVLFVMRSAD